MSTYDHLNTDAINAVIAEINSLKESRKLLEAIWQWYGPYGPRPKIEGIFKPATAQLAIQAAAMPEALVIKLQKHFKFDDSE